MVYFFSQLQKVGPILSVQFSRTIINYQGIVLVRGQGLLSPGLAAHHHKGEFPWSRPQLFQGNFDQTFMNGLSHRSNDAGDIGGIASTINEGFNKNREPQIDPGELIDLFGCFQSL